MLQGNLLNLTNDFAEISSRELAALIAKYSVSGPRYTSYPTAVEFNSALSLEDWETAIKKAAGECAVSLPQSSLSLYFHIPFCQSLCYYCACNKVVPKDRSVVSPYLKALGEEMSIYARMLGTDISVKQLHWGGGTPNYLSPQEICQLQRQCKEAYANWSSEAEISIEVDPRSVTAAHIDALMASGFNRISVGVQDFNPAVQEAINRVQSFELTRDLCKAARGAGFRGVNIDLIYGLPQQTVSSFLDTIDKVIAIRPDRIALYGYAHVQWLQKVQKSLERSFLPEPAERINIFVESIKRLTSEGYCYIGMDHFALPHDSLYIALREGYLMRNFMGYTAHKGAQVIGHGVSSISSLSRAYWQNTKDLDKYQHEVAQGRLPIERGLLKTEEDAMRAEIIQDILCQGYVDIKSLAERFGVDFFSTFADEMLQLVYMERDGLVSVNGSGIRLTSLGRLFMRNVAMAFDAYLSKHRAKQAPVFSQTV